MRNITINALNGQIYTIDNVGDAWLVEGPGVPYGYLFSKLNDAIDHVRGLI